MFLFALTTSLCAFEIKREFDEKSFALAYDVFVGAHNFAAAVETAKIGVQKSKEHTLWLEKLAKVALWSNDTTLALASYKELAKQKQTDEIISELARLSMALGDKEGMLIVYEHNLRLKKVTKEDLAAFLRVYEELGEVKKGINTLKEMYAHKKDPLILDAAALMSEKADDLDEALRLYELHIKNHGMTADNAAKTARVLFRKGEFDKAFEVMNDAMSTKETKDAQFFELYGELAWQGQHEKEAKYAYESLSKLTKLKEFQTERLVILTVAENPLQAAQIAKTAYEQDGSEAMLIQALNIYMAQNNDKEAWSLINSASKKSSKDILKSSSFSLAKAELHMRQRHYDAALGELEHALITNKSNDIRELILIASVEKGDRGLIFYNLRRFEPFLSQNKKYFDALASAYSAISMHQKALKLYELSYYGAKNREVALLNLIAAYDALGYEAKSLNLKEKLWQKVEKTEINATNPAQASYIFSKLSSDAKLLAMQKYLNNTKEYAVKYQYLSEIAAFDALKKAIFADAKAKIEAPEWAVLPLANEMRDFEVIETMLGAIRILPEYDEMEGYTITKKIAQKESAAFEKMDKDGYDDESHRRFGENYFENANNINAGFEYARQPDIETLHSYLGTKIKPYRSVAITAEFEKNKNTLHSQEVLKQTSYQDTRYTLGVQKEYANEAKSDIRLTKRKSMREFICVDATYDLTLDRDTSIAIVGGYNSDSKESAALVIGGAKDYAAISATYRVSKRENISINHEFDVLKAQNGAKLAEASITMLSAGYQARTEYPDINTRVYYEFARYRQGALDIAQFSDFESIIAPTATPADLTSDILLPNTYAMYGIDIGIGESVSGTNSYSKALRPYAVLSLSNNTRYGVGYAITSGFVTSLEGKDRFQMYVSYGQGGEGSLITNGINKSLGFSYLLGF